MPSLDEGLTTPSPIRKDFYTGVVVDVTAQQKFERELGNLVDRYRLLTEVSPDVVVVHQNGRLVYGNRAAVRLVGAGSMEEHYGRPITDFVHPSDIVGTLDRIAQLTEDGQFFEHGEARIVSLDGSVTVMEVTSVRTSWAGAPAFQVIMRDISERRAAEAANRYRASLVAHVSDAIIGIDADGKIESWNEAAEAIYGWTEEEVVGHSIAAVVTANRTDSAAVLERGQRSHRRKDGSDGRRDGLDRPPHRRRHPAVGVGRGLHRAHRRPPGRSRAAGRRAALRGGGRVAQRGHRALRRVRARSPPTTRQPAASSANGSPPGTATRSSPAPRSPSTPTATRSRRRCSRT